MVMVWWCLGTNPPLSNTRPPSTLPNPTLEQPARAVGPAQLPLAGRVRVVGAGEPPPQRRQLSGNSRSVARNERSLNQCAIGLTRLDTGPFIVSVFRAAHPLLIRRPLF